MKPMTPEEFCEQECSRDQWGELDHMTCEPYRALYDRYQQQAQEIAKQAEYIQRMKDGWIKRDAVIGKLDEAMATPEHVAEDTRIVGGFVSSLDLTETDEQIVDRAIAKVQQQEKILSDLSVIVGCASPDSSAELDQVRYYQERMQQQAQEIERLRDGILSRDRMLEAYRKHLDDLRGDHREALYQLNDDYASRLDSMNARVRELEKALLEIAEITPSSACLSADANEDLFDQIRREAKQALRKEEH